MLTAKQTIETLGVCRRQFFYLLKAGKLTRIWVDGRMYFDEKEVESLKKKPAH